MKIFWILNFFQFDLCWNVGNEITPNPIFVGIRSVLQVEVMSSEIIRLLRVCVSSVCVLCLLKYCKFQGQTMKFVERILISVLWMNLCTETNISYEFQIGMFNIFYRNVKRIDNVFSWYALWINSVFSCLLLYARTLYFEIIQMCPYALKTSIKLSCLHYIAIICSINSLVK